ncbi:MAG: hypothetical protein WCR42_05125 [bacterium]
MRNIFVLIFILSLVLFANSCKTTHYNPNYRYLYLEYELLDDSECGQGLDPGELYLAVKSQFGESPYIYPINVGDNALSKHGFISTPIFHKGSPEKIIFTMLDQNMVKATVGELSRELTEQLSTWLDKDVPNPAGLLPDWTICGEAVYSASSEFALSGQPTTIIINDKDSKPKLKITLTYVKRF